MVFFSLANSIKNRLKQKKSGSDPGFTTEEEKPKEKIGF
jgi:hypothetical protein